MCVCVCARARVCVCVCVCVCVTMKKKCQTNSKHDKRHRRAYACSINHYIVSFSRMHFLRNFERFNNLHAYHGRVGGNQLLPVNLLLPRMTGRNMRPHVIYFTNWPPLRLRWAHYFRMRDHGFSLFSAVKNLHLTSSDTFTP